MEPRVKAATATLDVLRDNAAEAAATVATVHALPAVWHHAVAHAAHAPARPNSPQLQELHDGI